MVYFYPSAYTGGCNIRAHTFAINHDKFTAAVTSDPDGKIAAIKEQSGKTSETCKSRHDAFRLKDPAE